MQQDYSSSLTSIPESDSSDSAENNGRKELQLVPQQTQNNRKTKKWNGELIAIAVFVMLFGGVGWNYAGDYVEKHGFRLPRGTMLHQLERHQDSEWLFGTNDGSDLSFEAALAKAKAFINNPAPQKMDTFKILLGLEAARYLDVSRQMQSNPEHQQCYQSSLNNCLNAHFGNIQKEIQKASTASTRKGEIQSLALGNFRLIAIALAYRSGVLGDPQAQQMIQASIRQGSTQAQLLQVAYKLERSGRRVSVGDMEKRSRAAVKERIQKGEGGE